MAQVKHIRPLIALGIPIVIGQLGTIAQAFADTIMVGQYGTPELSASGFVNNVFNLIFFFLLGFSYSTTPIVGAFFGRKQQDDCSRTLKESLLANIMLCVLVMLCMLILYFNLGILNQPEELMPLIRSYYIIILLSLPFLSAFNAIKQFCDGVGDTRSPMYIMLAGNVINIVGNYLLIYGFSLPFSSCLVQPMGLNGAGIATLASRIIMVMMIWGVVKANRRYAAFRNGFRKKITKRGFWHLTKVGMPIGMQLALEAASFNITAIMMGWLGATALAAHQAMCTIGMLCFMFYYGIGAAAAIRISHFKGQGENREVRRIAFTAYAMTLVAAVVLTSAIVIGFRPLCFCFTTSEDVVAMTATLLIPFVVYQLGDSTQVLFSNALRAIQDVKPLMLYAAIAYLLVSIPSSYIFAFKLHLGPQGIWFGFPFGLTTAGILFLQRFYRKT